MERDEVERRLTQARMEQWKHGHDWDIADIVPVVMDMLGEEVPVGRGTEYMAGDTYEYINSSGVLITWTRKASGSWVPDQDIPYAPMFDEGMRRFLRGLLVIGNPATLKWRFTKYGFRQLEG